MKLKQFQIKNYRSINDSGEIEVSQRTALVGRNESGKSNLLLALHSLNPSGTFVDLSYVKDFPRDRHANEFSENIYVVESSWELSAEDQRALADVYPRAAGVIEVTVKRSYKALRYIGLTGLSQLEVDHSAVKDLADALQTWSEGDQPNATVISALSTFCAVAAAVPSAAAWATSVLAALVTLRQTLTANAITLPTTVEEPLAAIEKNATSIVGDDKDSQQARLKIMELMPKFLYLDDYPEIEGHQDITGYLQRRQQNTPLPQDVYFTKLMKVAGLDAVKLNALLGQSHEERQQLANRAGAVVTRKLRELWTDRSLKVRFNLDANHFDTLISDPNAVYDVEVNLNERSRGFKWFFSFYITFAADTAGGSAENAILLLDEPGLFLHAVAQRNLLSHFANDYQNQIIYTTHSPFMIPVDDIRAVRTVNIGEDTGTTVANDPVGDEKTLFPIQTALSYDLTQTLFVGEKNLVVEGVTDYWYLSTASDYLNDIGNGGLPRDLVLTPAGGAQKIPYMAALLAAQNLKVLVLLDDEDKARTTADEIVKAKLLRRENLIFVTEAFASVPAGGADVEDMLDPSTYELLIMEAFQKELAGRTLAPNLAIPRLTKRYEEALKVHGIGFSKTRPAKLFLQYMGTAPETIMTSTSQENYTRLFRQVGQRLDALNRRRPDLPF